MNRDQPDRPPLCPEYVTEGQFLAWPLAVQGECDPIEPDSARISALAATPDGRLVWGATRGESCHIFAAAFKGAAGGIVDTGTLPHNPDDVALLALPPGHPLAANGSHTVLAAASSGDHFSIWRQSFNVPRDAIQEPGFAHPQPQCIIPQKPGHCLGMALQNNAVLCLTTKGLRRLTAEPPELVQCTPTRRNAPPPAGRLAMLDDCAWWIDTRGTLNGVNKDNSDHPWHPHLCDSPEHTLLTAAPAGRLIAAQTDGGVLAIAPEQKLVEHVATAPLPQIQCLAPLPDGRIYGFCGSGIGHFFRIDLHTQTCTALGAVATALGTHRYAFAFGCATVTADGIVLFGEDDRGGHLWTFFPPLAR